MYFCRSKLKKTIMNINANTIVGDIVKVNFKTAQVLEKSKIDFCCGGGISLKEACEDTKKHFGIVPKWSEYYSCYTDTCEVCGDETECTESWDAGRPSFEFMLPRLRARKIKKIMDK